MVMLMKRNETLAEVQTLLEKAKADKAEAEGAIKQLTKQLQSDFGQETLALLEQPGRLLPEAIVWRLLAELRLIARPLVVILDDYHLIQAPAIGSALDLLLQHLPSTIHFLLSSRAIPGLPLARLRVEAQLMELDAASLRFTAVEAGRFLNERLHLNLTAEERIALERRTEG